MTMAVLVLYLVCADAVPIIRKSSRFHVSISRWVPSLVHFKGEEAGTERSPVPGPHG